MLSALSAFRRAGKSSMGLMRFGVVHYGGGTDELTFTIVMTRNKRSKRNL